MPSFALQESQRGGIARSPWSLPDAAGGWACEDKDQEIAEGVSLEFIITGSKSPSRVVAVRAPVVEAEDALQEFATGIRSSFVKGGVEGLEESEDTRWGLEGLGMRFAIASDAGKVHCDAFFFESEGKFWAIMAFGPTKEDNAAAFLAVKRKTVEE